MIRAVSIFEDGSDTLRSAMELGRRAVEELGTSPDWCIVYATADHAARHPQLLETLQQTTGTPYLVGCSAAGVIAGDREVEAGSALGLLAVTSDTITATPFRFPIDGDGGLAAGTHIGQRLHTSQSSDDLVLVWPDPFSVRPRLLLEGIDAVLGGVPVAGAAAAGHPERPETFQFHGTDGGSGAVAGLRLGGRFRHRVAVGQGCRIVDEPCRITRAHDNMILEIEGRPALEALRQQIPGAGEPGGPGLGSVFVGLPPVPADVDVPDWPVRPLVAFDPDTGVLVVSERVGEGQPLVFAARDGQAARDALSERLAAVCADRWTPAFGLYFNCLGRGEALYGEPGVDSAVIRRYFPGLPVLGCFGNVEIAPYAGENRVLMQTGVLVLVGE